MTLTLEDLEGRYESGATLGPGTRYVLELDGPAAGVKPGERFRLAAAAWALTGRNVPGTDRPDVRLLGTRRLDGGYRLDADGLILDARFLSDTPGDGQGLGHPAPIRRPTSEKILVEMEGRRLTFLLYGSHVTVSKI